MLGGGITEMKSHLLYHLTYTITNLFKTVTFHEKVVKMLKPPTQTNSNCHVTEVSILS